MKARHLSSTCAMCASALVMAAPQCAEAAKVISVGALDKDYVVVQVSDGDVAHEAPGEKVTRYTPELSATAAAQASNFIIKSTSDANYGATGKNPTAAFRKKKLSGQAQMEWVSSDYRYDYTYQHWIYLKLPNSLQQGMAYTLEIAAATNVDITTQPFTFDVYNNRSEALHVNLVGYAPDAPHKAADLYSWLGDGGARDYTPLVNNKVYLYDVATKQATEVGKVAFWKASAADVGGYNLTRSSVWNADFSAFTTPGTYRLVVDGVGCSQDFQIATGIYADPFKISLRGFFYMRLGQDNPTKLSPPPRTPLYLPGADPATTKVYLTTMQPTHAQWASFSPADVWDHPNDWAPYRKSGNPTNPNAFGGHADAADLDRHLGHISIVYDMLLPYILTKGAISDDNAGISESGNGIADVLDEARFEVDFWLRVRDGKDFGYGITNPNSSNEFFQAGTNAMAAWASAANAAMLADAFRIAGNKTLADQYVASAVEAYGVANASADTMLDKTMDAGGATFRGRDLKMTAAAFLYNVTGDQTYEAVVQSESTCASATSVILNSTRNQLWATAGYLLTPQTVHFQSLWNNMKASVISQAKSVEAAYIDTRPSRRATNQTDGYFRTIQNVHHTLVAHAITTDATEKSLFRKALALEADWGLGRNPGNFIEMGTSTTPLETKRGITYMYTAGRDDGVPGTTPGQTPYCNLDDWDTSMTMGSPSKLYADAYPTDFKNTWPMGEACFETPWVWAHNEFTPQQTMRGKTALYGYLYGLDRGTVSSGTGGMAGSGGKSGAGGAGGAVGSGGTLTQGGAVSNGGTLTQGGAVGRGGTVGNGGMPSQGGASGGAGTSVAQGGSASTSGTVNPSGGEVAAGGAVGNGGAVGSTTALSHAGKADSTGTPDSKASGCTCHVAGSSRRNGTLLSFLAVAFAAAVRRRARKAPTQR